VRSNNIGAPGVPFRWLAVGKQLLDARPGTTARLRPYQVEHPRDAGMQLAVALPLGQRAAYRLALSPQQDLVVSDFITHYDARLEARVISTVEAALREQPATSAMQMICGGALVGLALGRSKEGALVGAAIGGLAALTGIGLANATTSPELAQMAVKMLTALQPQAAPPRAPKARRVARHSAPKRLKPHRRTEK
jgi:hypothetical protein